MNCARLDWETSRGFFIENAADFFLTHFAKIPGEFLRIAGFQPALRSAFSWCLRTLNSYQFVPTPRQTPLIIRFSNLAMVLVVQRDTLSNSPGQRTAVIAALLTKIQLAGELQVSKRSVDYWTHQGMIPAIRCGRLIRYDLSDVLAHLKRTSPKHSRIR